MNFIQLKAFHFVVKRGSFTNAARDLNVSQSTISAHVQNLEEQYNIQLIRRNKNTICLTDEGKIVFSHAKKIFSIADNLKLKMGNMGTPSSKIIRIGCAPSIGQYILPQIVAFLKKDNPYLEFHIHTGIVRDILKKVIDSEYDLGLVGKISYPNNISCRQILNPKYHFITADTKIKNKIRLEELSHYPIILSSRGSVTHEYILNEFEKRNIPLDNCIYCENVSAIKQMVHLGLGGSFFPFYAIKDDVKEGKYRSIEILDDLFLTIDMIYLSKKRKTKTIQSFISTLENLKSTSLFSFT